MKFFERILLFALSVFVFSSAVFAQTVDLHKGEFPRLSKERLLLNFYSNKSKQVLKDNQTYRQRYNAVAFMAYPRTFWEDTLPGLAPYDKKGELFKDILTTSYRDIKDAGNINSVVLAEKTAAKIILNPRRIEVSKNIPFPEVGDTWYMSFYLTSYYQQINDFISKISSEEKTYKEYSKYLASGNSFMMRGYENYDFSLGKGSYNKDMFYRRKNEIETFVKAYTAVSGNFIRKVLVPLQTGAIEGADVKSYLDRNLTMEGVPAGVSAKALKAVILEQIGTPDYYYREAEKIDPSFMKQIFSAGRVLFAAWTADRNDLFDALSLFEYISPGVLAERLNKYGKIPSREVMIEDIASSLAAGALNKSLAQIANDLFEFEKPFYYSDHSFAGAENDIVENWYKVASNQFFSDNKIAQIAADNIINSGRRQRQDMVLMSTLKQRRINKNLSFYATAFPVMLDFAGGDAAFILASPMLKSGRYLARARTADLQKTFKNIKSLKFDKDMKLPMVIVKAKSIAPEIASVRNIKSGDGLLRPVWELRNSSGEVVSYLKYGAKQELSRTKQIDRIIKNNKLAEKFDLLEIEYPKVLGEGLDNIPEGFRAQIKEDMISLSNGNMRDAANRFNSSFIMNKVDISGFTMHGANSSSLKLLNNTPITSKEWKQIVDFYGELNRSGFYHTDVWNNLHIRRLPDGKLKITLLDFEHLGVSDMQELQDFEGILRSLGLREKKGSANYLKEYGPAAAKADKANWVD